MIVLFTDFGIGGPYTGQVKAVLARDAPGIRVIDLMADAPIQNPRAAAYLLASLIGGFGPGTVFLGVVDPGVGSERLALVVEADGRWYVGPDNGLFELVIRRASGSRVFEIAWQPPSISATFHGRDLFAPVAARLALGAPPPAVPLAEGAGRRRDWPDDLAEIVYVDHYGNAMTGLRAAALGPRATLTIGGRRLPRARTFFDVGAGEPFWYENANGLVEIAVNLGRADRSLGLAPGSPVTVSR